jgi:hypothetical protein
MLTSLKEWGETITYMSCATRVPSGGSRCRARAVHGFRLGSSMNPSRGTSLTIVVALAVFAGAGWAQDRWKEQTKQLASAGRCDEARALVHDRERDPGTHAVMYGLIYAKCDRNMAAAERYFNLSASLGNPDARSYFVERGLPVPAAQPRATSTGQAPPLTDNTVQFLINTEPQGASVYYDGKLIGVTPLRTNSNPLTAEERANRKIRTGPVTFVWVSGAKVVMHLTATWQSEQRAYRTAVTITRPAVEGYLRDAEHANRGTQTAEPLVAAQPGRSQEDKAGDAAASVLGLILQGAAAYYEGKNSAPANFDSIGAGESSRPRVGYSGPGGPCSSGPGGGLYTGPGGGAYTGPGGGAYTGPGGGAYTGPGGGAYTGPGGGAYTGPGGGAYTGPGGGAYTGPGGGAYSGPGGPCNSGPGGSNPDPWNRPSPHCK